ncbi:hypothetical protein AURDEDRAFT_156851 [Auricularia subglabra TFB-10046 SS5]|nr:hypothetical protein AURDEDRAFT_156851 [Auricularia subglabra TFB-10046 SS5]
MSGHTTPARGASDIDREGWRDGSPGPINSVFRRHRDASPASTMSTTSTNARLAEPATRNSISPTVASTVPRRTVLRGDPSLHTCFSPADKEIYDLWAPPQ